MEFAHIHKSLSEVTIDPKAAFTLVLHKANGAIETMDSNDTSFLNFEDHAIDKAMFAVKDYDDHCDVFHYGEEFGTAEYVDMTPNSFFSGMQVVFSTPYC